MHALWLTKVLKPPPQRIARLGHTWVLPRAMTTHQLYGAGAGAVLGLLAGAILGGGFLIIPAIFLGIMFGTWIVDVQPWPGEHIGKVLMARLRSWNAMQRMICPGSHLPVVTVGGEPEHCVTCGLMCDVRTDTGYSLAAPHEWKREFYLGLVRVRPDLRPIRCIPGSVRAAQSRT